MKTRIEAIKFIEKDFPKINKNKWDKYEIHHIGAIEIRALLDFIYEGEPMTEAEKLKGIYT